MDACCLPCCTMRSEKLSPVCICVLLLCNHIIVLPLHKVPVDTKNVSAIQIFLPIMSNSHTNIIAVISHNMNYPHAKLICPYYYNFTSFLLNTSKRLIDSEHNIYLSSATEWPLLILIPWQMYSDYEKPHVVLTYWIFFSPGRKRGVNMFRLWVSCMMEF